MEAEEKLVSEGKESSMKKVIINKYVIYTICFWAFIGPLIYYISSIGLFAGGHSDAIWQHYPIMVYIRKFWMNIFNSLWNRESLIVPMIDFSIGMGEDVISALNYYGFGDPFYLLTIFVSEENLPYFYSVFFYFRVYLGGAAFIVFISELDKTKSISAYVIGALVYSFSGFAVQSNMHIIFTHAMMYIPLMMLGAEKSMHGKRKGMLCITTFCFALSGFFFLYIGSISLAVYVLYRLFREKRGWKDAVKRIWKLIIEHLLGMGMASVIFIPAVLGFLSSNRAQIKSGYPLIVSWDSIKSILLNMFQPSYDNLGQETAVCTIGMITIICILLARKKMQEKLNLILLFLLTIIPFFNVFMSGFGRSHSRWQVVISMYMAFLTVIYWDELGSITTFQKVGVALVYLLLGIIGIKDDILQHERFGKTILSYGIILAALLIVLPLLKRLGKEKIGKYILFFAAYITICINWKAIARDRDIEAVNLRQVAAELVDNDEQESFYRIDNEQGKQVMNISLCQGYNGIMQYVSIPNNRYASAFEKWDIANVTHMTWSGLDQRAILETMCAVKYFIANEENNRFIPYGFEYVKSTEEGKWGLYQNKYALPIAYTYDEIYNVEDYQKLSGIEKQQVMLQAAAVEGMRGGYIEPLEIEDYITAGTYEISNLENVALEKNIIKGEADGRLKISIDIKSGCENYFFYTGEVNTIDEIEIDNSYVKEGHPLSPFVINLGTVKENRTMEIVLTFKHAFELDKNNIQILYYDFSNYARYIDALKKDTEGKFKVGTNYIGGSLALEQNKILCFSIPYSRGWSAKIDEKEVEIYPVNDLFMGVEVSKGKHQIELFYVTPGIKVGAVISACSLAVIIFMIVRPTIKKYAVKDNGHKTDGNKFC